jgi:hypothetical protein
MSGRQQTYRKKVTAGSKPGFIICEEFAAFVVVLIAFYLLPIEWLKIAMQLQSVRFQQESRPDWSGF